MIEGEYKLPSSKWQLVVCGINHATASTDERGAFQVVREEMARANSSFSLLPAVRESAILSTCNRIEFYFVADRSRKPLEIIGDFYGVFSKLPFDEVSDKFYIHKGTHAARHLFRVIAGLDSVVVGEKQIAGQVKEAYRSACAVKSAGKILHRLFHQAFRVGKIVRTDTEMGKGACSVASAAISLIRPAVLFVGAGQMIRLAAMNMSRLHHGEFSFANRTVEHLEDLSKDYRAKVYPLAELTQALGEADVVVSCTGSAEPLISSEMIANAISNRPDRPLVLMDMAVPGDIQHEGTMNNVTYFNLDDVKAFVENRQSSIEEEIPRAEDVIAEKMQEFDYWYEHVIHEPLYNGLEETFDMMRREELAALIDGLPPDKRDAVDRATRRLVNKLLQVRIRLEADPDRQSSCRKRDSNGAEVHAGECEHEGGEGSCGGRRNYCAPKDRSPAELRLRGFRRCPGSRSRD